MWSGSLCQSFEMKLRRKMENAWIVKFSNRQSLQKFGLPGTFDVPDNDDFFASFGNDYSENQTMINADRMLKQANLWTYFAFKRRNYFLATDFDFSGISIYAEGLKYFSGRNRIGGVLNIHFRDYDAPYDPNAYADDYRELDFEVNRSLWSGKFRRFEVSGGIESRNYLRIGNYVSSYDIGRLGCLVETHTDTGWVYDTRLDYELNRNHARDYESYFQYKLARSAYRFTSNRTWVNFIATAEYRNYLALADDPQVLNVDYLGITVTAACDYMLSGNMKVSTWMDLLVKKYNSTTVFSGQSYSNLSWTTALYYILD